MVDEPDTDAAIGRLPAAYQAAFATDSGRIVLADLLRAAGLLAVCHTPGDPCDTAFNDGRRSLGLHVVQQLRWSEAELLKLALARTAGVMKNLED
jgi:hypothetical protein